MGSKKRTRMVLGFLSFTSLIIKYYQSYLQSMEGCKKVEKTSFRKRFSGLYTKLEWVTSTSQIGLTVHEFFFVTEKRKPSRKKLHLRGILDGCFDYALKSRQLIILHTTYFLIICAIAHRAANLPAFWNDCIDCSYASLVSIFQICTDKDPAF